MIGTRAYVVDVGTPEAPSLIVGGRPVHEACRGFGHRQVEPGLFIVCECCPDVERRGTISRDSRTEAGAGDRTGEKTRTDGMRVDGFGATG